jgi:hypothetical protein
LPNFLFSAIFRSEFSQICEGGACRDLSHSNKLL